MIFIELFVEEQSAEAALINLIPAILGDADYDFDIITFQGKKALLRKLPDRLRAYKHWLREDHYLVVLIDRDSDDCNTLKQQLETIAINAGLSTKTTSPEKPFEKPSPCFPLPRERDIFSPSPSAAAGRRGRGMRANSNGTILLK